MASDLEISAFHEAGHYLYGYLHGMPLDGIIMESDSGGVYRAAVKTADLQGWIDATEGPERLGRIRLAIGFKLAGQQAQTQKFGNQSGAVEESGRDLMHVTIFRRQIEKQFPCEDQQQLMASIQQSVNEYLAGPAVQAAIDALAVVLARGHNLSHDQVLSIIDPYVSTRRPVM
jgi:hypothetical protein